MMIRQIQTYPFRFVEEVYFIYIGTEIDWKEDFMGARFVFDNPQAKSKCGCGTSFSINFF